jgi:hypothetical protein
MVAGYTKEQCEQKCLVTPDCKGYAMGKAAAYMNRCDLWKTLDLDYQATHKFDFYYP